MERDWKRNPNRTSDMEEARTNQIDELIYKTRLNSAKINLLQKEMKQVNLENDLLREYVQKQRDAENARPEPDTEDCQKYREARDDTVVQNPAAPAYLRNSSQQCQRPEVEYVTPRREKMHFGMERFYNCDSSLISANETKYRLFLGNQEQQQVQQKQVKQPHYGCFYIMRFHHSGCINVELGLKSMTSILRNCLGFVLGVANKDRIYVMENSPEDKNWLFSRNRSEQGYMTTENALAAIWFTDQQSAENFFHNTYRNRFREYDAPTQHGYEVFYVPANCTPADDIHRSYLCIELKDVRRYDPTNLTQFEGELCCEILKLFPDSLPMIVSSRRREEKKPGNMLSVGSKLYVCMFRKQKDIDHIYQSGKIHDLKDKWNLHGPMQIFSFTLLP